MSRNETLDTLRQQIQMLEESDCADFYKQLNHNDSVSSQDIRYTENEECATEAHSSHCEDKPLKKRDAFSRIVGLVNASEKSTLAIRKRLVQSGYTDIEIDEALEYATNCGLIDDNRYARILIQSRIRQGWGSSGIERELTRNGIDPSLIEGWPHDYPVSEDDQFERALAYLRSKPPRSKNLRESAYRKLVQKGYPSSLASQAARVWVSEITVQ